MQFPWSPWLKESKRRELAQHAHSRGPHTFTRSVISTQLQPRCAKRQLSYYRIWNQFFILFYIQLVLQLRLCVLVRLFLCELEPKKKCLVYFSLPASSAWRMSRPWRVCSVKVARRQWGHAARTRVPLSRPWKPRLMWVSFLGTSFRGSFRSGKTGKVRENQNIFSSH